jgi:ribose 5-phosphate isomerase B
VDDYPKFIHPTAEAVARDAGSRGVIFGASGQGEAVVANRVRGIRAVVYYGGSLDMVKHTRNDDDANVLSFGAKFISEDDAKEALKVWLETPFSQAERHVRRIAEIDA